MLGLHHMMLTDLAVAARKSGLNVVERPGWTKRGHGTRGIVQVRTIVCHHTAGRPDGNAPTLNYIEERILSQLVLGRDGTVYVVAAGLCYHAGVVSNPSYGNSYSIGIEAEATGKDSWPQVQYDAYRKLCAALMVHYKVPLSNVLGHKEVASPKGRKSDPNFDMNVFRRGIVAAPHQPIQEDPFMALSEAEQRELLTTVRELKKNQTFFATELAKLKPGLRLPSRSVNQRVKEDDQYGHIMNAAGEAADGRRAIEVVYEFLVRKLGA